ncbi:MAG: ABC transporter substrate-binding protein [Bacteroidales bacterium]|nr:ABC transporter substrate-binding protein [Bacteroidales bacterium]
MKNQYILLAIFILLFSQGCHRPSEGDGKAIFRYNESAGISTLDPAFAKDQAIIWAVSQLYNGLVRLDTNLMVEPCIAKRWEISEDGKTYTFTLRDNVFFHENELFDNNQLHTRKVVASDFEYSFNRILDDKVASPGLWIFSHIAENGFQAVNDSTFVVRLKEPFSPMLSILAMPYCSVVPREVVEHWGSDFRSHPCGTGPFYMKYWKEGVKLVMRRNENYFEYDTILQTGIQTVKRLPYLDAVAVTFIIDKQTAFLEFVKGNLDFMNSLDASYKDEILTPKGQLKEKYANRIDMVSTPFLNTEYLGFNMEGSEFRIQNSKLIRKAINYGFDRRKMMKYMRNNVGMPGCKGMIPCGLPGYDTASSYGYEYNPSRAKELLAEAGYPDGRGLHTLSLTTTSSYLDLCKYIQQQLTLIGINVKIDVNPPAALREQIAQGKNDWFRGSWIADYPDAENYLALFYSKNHSPAGPNYTRFTSKAFDRLYERSLTETDEQRRQALYRSMDSLVMSEAPVIVLYYDQILHFTHKNVKGLRSNAMNALDLRFVKIGEL